VTLLPIKKRLHLLLFLLLATLILLLSCLGLLSPDTTRATATKRRGERKVNVLLGVETDDEGGNVDDLLADTVADELARYHGK